MRQYLNLLEKVLVEGEWQDNRTGIPTIRIDGAMLQFDLTKGFPAVTTKKLAFNQVKGELIGFIRGYDNAGAFRGVGCNIWDQNANENQAWLDSNARKGPDDLGRIYGIVPCNNKINIVTGVKITLVFKPGIIIAWIRPIQIFCKIAIA